MPPINESHIFIEPWNESDINLLHHMNTTYMMRYLGGPENLRQIYFRHKHYLEMSKRGSGQMFSIILLPSRTKIGCVGYWERIWNKKNVYEIGWSVLPPFQGKGLATIAVKKAIAFAQKEQKHRSIHAFPCIHNHASNKVCQKLNFTLKGNCNLEYPVNELMQCNNWKLKFKK